LEGAKLIEN